MIRQCLGQTHSSPNIHTLQLRLEIWHYQPKVQPHRPGTGVEVRTIEIDVLMVGEQVIFPLLQVVEGQLFWVEVEVSITMPFQVDPR